MKSQSAARLRSMGFGLQAALSRTRSALAFRLPARTWIRRASQLLIAALPACVSFRRTLRLCRQQYLASRRSQASGLLSCVSFGRLAAPLVCFTQLALQMAGNS
jgi:hypothetical protein